MALNKKDFETITGIVNNALVENNKVLLARIDTMEKQIKKLSVDNAVKETPKATKSASTKKSAPKTKATSKKSAKVESKVLNAVMEVRANGWLKHDTEFTPINKLAEKYNGTRGTGKDAKAWFFTDVKDAKKFADAVVKAKIFDGEIPMKSKALK